MSTVQTRVGAFVWHECLTGDTQAAQRFYAELFGWEIEVWKPGEFDYAMIKAFDTMHGGFFQTDGTTPPHWLGHVCVDDVDAAAARVGPAGGTVVRPRTDIPEVGAMAVVQDPTGAIVSPRARCPRRRACSSGTSSSPTTSRPRRPSTAPSSAGSPRR
jgi:predicted enzyme related to lactoylglutathione lyase